MSSRDQTRELKCKIIDIVKEHPELYDISHPQYVDKLLKEQLWESIGIHVGCRGNDARLMFEAVKKEYSNQRAQYLEKHRSGAAGGIVYEPTWPLWKQCGFLGDCMKKRNRSTKSNIMGPPKSPVIPNSSRPANSLPVMNASSQQAFSYAQTSSYLESVRTQPATTPVEFPNKVTVSPSKIPQAVGFSKVTERLEKTISYDGNNFVVIGVTDPECEHVERTSTHELPSQLMTDENRVFGWQRSRVKTESSVVNTDCQSTNVEQEISDSGASSSDIPAQVGRLSKSPATTPKRARRSSTTASSGDIQLDGILSAVQQASSAIINSTQSRVEHKRSALTEITNTHFEECTFSKYLGSQLKLFTTQQRNIVECELLEVLLRKKRELLM